MADKKPQFYARDRAVWRRWLKKHHAEAQVIYLVFYRKSTGKPCITYDAAVEEALCFGWIDGVKSKLDDERYSYRFTPRRKGSRWSDSNKRRIEKLLSAGKMHPAGLAVLEEAKRLGQYDKSGHAATPRRMPVELARALKGSQAARATYDSLTPTQKRNYQGWIADGKKVETRQRRAAKAVQMLADGIRSP